MWNPLHPMSVECVGRIIPLTGVLNYYIVMGLNAGRECRGQAYVIGACARDILPKAVHLCAQNVMVDITSCYVGSNLFQRGLLPMCRVSINMCQWRARKFPELSSRCQVWNHRPVTRLKLLVKWFLSVRAHVCCYKLPELKCEGHRSYHSFWYWVW